MIRRINSLWLILFVLLFTFSCSKDNGTGPSINEAEEIVKYLESNGDYVNTTLPSIISATELKQLLETNKAYVVDVREKVDFDQGRIKGAVNLKLNEIINHFKNFDFSKYEKIVFVCYTGQTAGFVTALMRFYYANEPTIRDKFFDLKFGMCSWHSDFAGKWKNAISNKYASQFVNTPPPTKPAKGSFPVLNTGKTTPIEIIRSRVETLLNEGFKVAGVTADQVFGALDKYFIANYWPEAQYTSVGHIPGAYNYVPKASLKLSADLLTLPVDKEIVLYCYTGQTSAFVSAYLRMLGYNAKSLLFGTNSMIYDKMVEAKMTVWKDTESMNYEYEK